ncbi:hypothetical protein H1D32_15390 [Anaerobacillus sp. CMMVII]|uniref:hypothetical protein n=1 Tax=Anaerobacillus sp. CMMVII TaxID=2755588 RepID=UPI0021B78B43|nr:hypothetical protein [Anaerobacillus sp. CMMVII]MCT8138973.1 hypothetical protein [Anaerobacillus sp. CMMVII]
MNRLQFLTELRKSLLKTTQEISLPIITDELEKFDELANQIVGVKWVKLDGITATSLQSIQEFFTNNKSILLVSKGGQLKAYGKMCLNCQSLTQWISYENKMKCSNCDKTLDVISETGDLTCKRYYTKEKNGEWFIGV